MIKESYKNVDEFVGEFSKAYQFYSALDDEASVVAVLPVDIARQVVLAMISDGAYDMDGISFRDEYTSKPLEIALITLYDNCVSVENACAQSGDYLYCGPDVAYVYKDFAAGFEKANSKANMIEVIGFNGETEKGKELGSDVTVYTANGKVVGFLTKKNVDGGIMYFSYMNVDQDKVFEIAEYFEIDLNKELENE